MNHYVVWATNRVNQFIIIPIVVIKILSDIDTAKCSVLWSQVLDIASSFPLGQVCYAEGQHALFHILGIAWWIMVIFYREIKSHWQKMRISVAEFECLYWYDTDSYFIHYTCLLSLLFDTILYITFSARIWHAFEIIEYAKGSHVNWDWKSGVDSKRRSVWYVNHCLNNVVYWLCCVCRCDYKRSSE